MIDREARTMNGSARQGHVLFFSRSISQGHARRLGVHSGHGKVMWFLNRPGAQSQRNEFTDNN